jgi:hypothetical protein
MEKIMRRLLIAAAIAVLSFPAFAADIPVKAPPVVSIGYPYAQSGIYFGVGASASAASATVANTGVFSAGAGLDGVVGYQWKGGLDFVAVEVIATYQNLGNAQACAIAGGVTSCSLSSEFEIDPRVKFGFPINTVLALLPNLAQYFPGLPQLPAGVNATNEHPYVFVGVPLHDVSANFGLMTGKEWTVQPEIGLGILSQWQSGLAVDVSAGCALSNVGVQVGPIANHASLGPNCQTRLSVLY